MVWNAPDDRDVRVGVIGAGEMGRHHIRILDEIEGVDLVAVADPQPAVLRRTLSRRAARGYSDYREMIGRESLDAVSIAVPSSAHHRVALDVIDGGISLLVEKPIAANSAQAWEIVERAERAGVTLAVGHVERFNPAIVMLRDVLRRRELGEIFQIKARRTGPFPQRIRDVGVVIDLATHDLDVMLSLIDAPVIKVYGETRRNIHTSHEDMLTALLRFSTGPIGSLDVNWLSPTKTRDLTVIGERGMFIVDYLTQNLVLHENGVTSNDWDHLSRLSGVSEGRMIRYVVPRTEPLAAELQAFVAAVRDGLTPAVTGRDGLLALELAEAVLLSGNTGRTVTIDHHLWDQPVRHAVTIDSAVPDLALVAAITSAAGEA